MARSATVFKCAGRVSSSRRPSPPRPPRASGPLRWKAASSARTTPLPSSSRDVDGRIVALKIRADQTADGPRYTTLSSKKHGGPGPGVQCHVPLHTKLATHTVRVTEGELKADVATGLSGVLTLSVPGVGNWRLALPVLHGFRPRQVRVAFDADWKLNHQVKRAAAATAAALLDEGFVVTVETWDLSNGKGIDDLLRAGLAPRCIPAGVILHHAFPEKSGKGAKQITVRFA